MKNLSHTLKLIALTTILFLSACLGAQSITGTDRDNILAYAGPKTDNLLNGYNSGDYTVFARDFDAAMLQAENQTVFTQTRAQLLAKLGKYTSRQISDVIKQDQYIVVLYTAKFEQADNVTVRLVFHPDGDHQITGLWFNSPTLQ